MKIGVGSKNKTKVNAVAELLREYPIFESAEVEGIAVKIDEFGHPKSLDETVAGAIDRAKQAWVGNDYGFGIEGGLMQVPYTKTGYMEVAACAIFDGKRVHLGLSPGCEWPLSVVDGILNKNLDGSQAMKAAGLTSEEKLGENAGFIAIVTKGRMDRTGFNKAAIMMALVHLENPEHY
jgi:inosine/xanthosine triphosphatase